MCKSCISVNISSYSHKFIEILLLKESKLF